VLDRTNDPFRVSIERAGPGQSSYEVKDRDVLAETLRYLEAQKPGEPFAVTVGLMLPHQPYVCSKADYELYAGRVPDPRLPAPGANAEHPYLRGWREHTGSLDLPVDWERRARTAYYGLTTAMDRMIGAILDKLDEAGLAQDTLVVYASDHGDQLGERGLWWKQTFYDQSVAIPLVMRWPGRLAEGERRGRVCNLLDVAATMLYALDAPALPAGQGRSLLEVARNPNSPWLDETFAEYCTDGVARWTGTAPVQQRMVRSGRFKLVYYHGLAPQLFDLAADPDELVDLAEDPDHRVVRKALTDRVLEDWDPDAIALRMSRRTAAKRLLSDWAQAVHPPEQHLWEVKMEDNWLDELSS
jgi:choline-sulfatase